MKTAIRLGLAALISFTAISCKKDTVVDVYEVPQNVEPNITSKIYPFTNQPTEMQFASGGSVLKTDDVVTVYIPYGVYKDKIVSAEIQLEDGTTGDVLATFPLNKETDPGTESLNIPQDLRDVPFMFVSFTVNSTFAGKYVSFKTSINGEKSFSNDALTNAFSVEL